MDDDAMIKQFCEPAADGVLLHIKVVPGASRSKIAGVLGDRLKVLIAAPPEDGKANKAICQLFGKIFSIPKRDVAVVKGTTNPIKTVQLSGLEVCKAVDVLQMLLK
ncbi:MAG: DUF167 domain-containing protein [Phycisphaeraceae bacterium JB051]